MRRHERFNAFEAFGFGRPFVEAAKPSRLYVKLTPAGRSSKGTAPASLALHGFLVNPFEDQHRYLSRSLLLIIREERHLLRHLVKQPLPLLA